MKKTSTKLWKVMKICAVQMMILIVACGISAAHESHAQVLERKVTVSVKDVSLETLIREIEGSARVRIFYSIDQLGVARPVSLQVVDRPLGEVLDEFFSPLQINFKVDEKREVITLKRRRSPPIQEETGMTDPPATRKGALLSVTGIVTDAATQLPMAGVNILVKGTTIGTTTDAEGRYSIEARDNDVLVFSFIGYVTFETVVNARSTIDVIMEVDTKNLDEVVINAGYWKVSDVERTGNISRVEAKEIERQPVSNPMAALIGRMPGVYITENSGVPGSGFTVRIRGRNSLRADGNDPLYVIDGVPFVTFSPYQNHPNNLLLSPSPLSSINPSDIESIEVLKDADATSIYGARGANGVVLITTKKGAKVGTKVEGSFDYGIGQVAGRAKLLDTDQYLEMRQEAFLNDGLSPGPTDYDVNGTWDQTRHTDWQDVFIGGTASFTDARLSVSGGSSRTRFLIGSAYNRQTTVTPGNMFYQRGTMHFNLSHSSDDNDFTISLSNNVSLENNNLANVAFTSLMFDLPPNAPALYDENGSLNWEDGTWSNPLAALQNKYENNFKSILSNVVFSYTFDSDLKVRLSMGHNFRVSSELMINPIRAQSPYLSSIPTGSAQIGRGSESTWVVEPQAEYQGGKGKGVLTALAGLTLQADARERLYITTSGIENDHLLENIAAAPIEGVISKNTSGQYRYAAVFARINYNWDQRYIINITGRRDGSSRFGPGSQFGNFAAVGAAWIFSNEAFARDKLAFINFGKIRASFGTSGSDHIGDYGYFDGYQSTNTQYQGAGLIPSRLANPDYGWESNKKIEGAVEAEFFRNRVSLGISYYRNRSSNQLVGLPLPGTTGFSSVQYNLPATVQNTGWEFQLSTLNLSKESGIGWETSFNISIPRNRLIKYPNLEASTHANNFRVGFPLDIALTYKYKGVNTETGLYEFDDLNGDGSITTADRASVVWTGVDFYGGLENTLQVHDFQLNISIQFLRRTDRNYALEFGTPGRIGNQPASIMNRWKSAGDMTSVQKFSTMSAANTARATRWVNSDAAYDNYFFGRIRNIALLWGMPAKWIAKTEFQACHISLRGQNLFKFSDYEGVDPEGAQSAMPPLRTVTLGIHLTF